MPRKPKKAPVQPIRDGEMQGGTAVAEPPETPFDPPKSPPPSATAPKADPIKTQMTFFDRVRAITLPDWGTRAYIRVYRLQPIIDRLRGSENKYIMKYEEPIDEDKIKSDHGSGRYRLYLAIKTAGGNPSAQTYGEKDVDTTEIEILDLAYPPKVPPGEWVEDSRNKKWAWAKPPGAGLPGGQPPAPAPSEPSASVFTEAMKTYGEIRRGVKEEIGSAAPPAAPGAVDEMTKFAGMVTALRSVFPTPAPSSDDRVLNSIVTLMSKQVEASQAEVRELRSAIMDMMKARTQEPPTPPRNQIKEIAESLKELAPTLKDLLPGAKEVVDNVRGGKTTFWDFAENVGPALFQTLGQVAVAFAPRPGFPANPPPQAFPPVQHNPAGPPRPPQAGAPPQAPPPAAPSAIPVEQQVGGFFSQPAVAIPFMNYFRDFVNGDQERAQDFAAWVHDGMGAEPMRLARSMGTERLMQLFRGSPAWPQLAPQEAKLIAFVDGVLQWNPDQEPDEDEGDEDENESINLATGGAE